jgi:hypothetical protein
MESFKIANFEKVDTGIAFPRFRSLSRQECNTLRARLIRLLNLKNADYSSIFNALSHEAATLGAICADDQQFDLRSALGEAGLSPPSQVFLNWGKLDNVDQMSLSDFAKYFSDIWYPAIDDLEVFDDGVTWCCIISHDGAVSIKKLR